MGGDLQVVDVTGTTAASCAMATACPLHYHQQGTQDNVQQWSKTAWNDISRGLKVLQVKQF